MKKLEYEMDHVEYHLGTAILRIFILILFISSIIFGLKIGINKIEDSDLKLPAFLQKERHDKLFNPDETNQKIKKNIVRTINLLNIETNEKMSELNLLEGENKQFIQIIANNSEKTIQIYFSTNKKGQSSYFLGEINPKFEINEFEITPDINLDQRPYLLLIDKHQSEVIAYSKIK